MKTNINTELNSIKSELSSIISELESISYGIRRDFSGIGNEKCSDCIDSVTSKYRTVKGKLDKIGTTPAK